MQRAGDRDPKIGAQRSGRHHRYKKLYSSQFAILRRPGRIAEGLVSFHHDWPDGLLEQHNESGRQDGQDGHPHQREPDK